MRHTSSIGDYSEVKENDEDHFNKMSCSCTIVRFDEKSHARVHLPVTSAVLFSAIRAAFVATDDATRRTDVVGRALVQLGRWWRGGGSRVPRLENQSTSILTVTAMTMTTTTTTAVAVAAMMTTAVRSGAKRSENPATAMSPMLFESARAAVSISRTNVRSCHTRIPRSERYKAERSCLRSLPSLSSQRDGTRRRPRLQSTKRTTTVCIPDGRNRCVHVPACTRT